jgi:hypothetical protein
MRFGDARPLLPAAVVGILIGAFLWIDHAAEKPSLRAAANQSGTWRLPGGADAELATFQPTGPRPPNDSTELAKLQEMVQALQSSNKLLSDQVSALAARLDNLGTGRAGRRRPGRR